MSSIVYGGLDVHQRSIFACLFCPDTGEVHSEELANDHAHLSRAVQRWSQMGKLRLCYEASSAGFVVQRWLEEMGVGCEVVAPSLIPRAAGERIKTDRRDARKLATLYRAGLLSPVRVPSREEEQVRALVRLRTDLTRDMTRVKNRVVKYLALQGLRYDQGKNWTQKHRTWLDRLPLESIPELILCTLLENLDALQAQREQLDGRIEAIAQTPPYATKVGRLMCLRGIALYSAMVLVTEIGDARRFPTAPHLMSYLGLVPREHSSGGRRCTGAITKTGNPRPRWILGQAAWNQRFRPGTSARLRKHWRSQPPEVVAIARKAQKRLNHKFWSIACRKEAKIAATAVAREMAGFVWALLIPDVA